jgi:hypothetical protein
MNFKKYFSKFFNTKQDEKTLLELVSKHGPTVAKAYELLEVLPEEIQDYVVASGVEPKGAFLVLNKEVSKENKRLIKNTLKDVAINYKYQRLPFEI